MDFAKILRAAETLAHIGRAASRFRSDINPGGGGAGAPREAPLAEEEQPTANNLTAGSRMFGQLEARLAGVLVSALKEAFDRDRAHLDMEREQIEHERKRAQELMRLELLRQAGEREIQNIRSSVIVTLVVWVTSALFVMVMHSGGVAAIVLLALGWALLFGALACAFAAYQQVSRHLVAASHATQPDGLPLARNSFASAVPVLIVLGLACTAASLLIRLAAG